MPFTRAGSANLARGPLIANHGFGLATGNAIVETGIADAVSFGRLFVTNPDLVGLFALRHELAASDRSTTTRGGARGYTDYPVWRAPQMSNFKDRPGTMRAVPVMADVGCVLTSGAAEGGTCATR